LATDEYRVERKQAEGKTTWTDRDGRQISTTKSEIGRFLRATQITQLIDDCDRRIWRLSIRVSAL